jgi:hypothetical protein
MDVPSRATPTTDEREGPASGWLAFAGTLFILVGSFNVLQGLVALLRDEYFVVTKDGLLFLDFTAWGWFWLIDGIVAVCVGFAVFANRTWARIVGVGLAGINAVMQLMFIAAFPLWTVIAIGLSVVAIYALVVPSEERYD